MGFREYARHVGIDIKSVFDRIASGAISPESIVTLPSGDRKIDSEKADADFAKRGNIQQKTAGDMNKAKAKVKQLVKETKEIHGQLVPVTKIPAGESNAPDPDDPFEKYRDAKTSTEVLRARKLELEVAEAEGRLLDANQVRSEISKIVNEVRERLLNLAPRVAPVLISISDVIEMENKLHDEINSALEGLQKLNDKHGQS